MNKIRVFSIRYRIFFIVSLFFIACHGRIEKCSKEGVFSQEETQRSWEENKKLFPRNKILTDWKSLSFREFDHNDLKEKVNNEVTDIYKKIIEYEPISLSLFGWSHSDRSLKISVFNFKNTLNAFGAYSKFRKPSLPLYGHRLLTSPSEAVYLSERLIVFRSHFLWIIDHTKKDLALLEKILDFMLSQAPNEELKHILLDALPASDRVVGSLYYRKKTF